MFNGERKNLFLSQTKESNGTERSAIIFNRLFEQIEPMEMKQNKDFASFNTSEAKHVVSQISRKASYLQQTLFFLSDYLKWCVMNGYTDKNSLVGIGYKDINVSALVRKELVLDVDDLISILRKAIPAESDLPAGTVDTNDFIRVAILLIYNGVDKKDVFGIKKSEVQILDNNLCFNNKIFEIDSYTLNLVKKIMNSDHMHKRTKNHGYSELLVSEYLIELYPTSSVKYRRLTEAMVMINEKHRNANGRDVSLSLDRVYEAGVFNRIHRNKASTNKYIRKGLLKKEFKTGRLCYIQQDYENWLLAWGLNSM